ncbi:hypothetical protein HBH92_031840 [Parastagonospora nodorum]|nr:hypothetical protein HBH52_204510 [Parastagonospora nodorum]KAH3971452.1 hypothetical protein HBH51_110220 [Parastagonospora nodorum]KAH4132817.1 hypothetical protein HBH47_004420 [Parastagonospora nodorum]KAH4178224.1 hypothetical protein HBH43_042040 [Parastagonospora nodorum]KAH4238191.1 hypothetical protein HBI06_036170 [Parastagonospora nodorum]
MLLATVFGIEGLPFQGLLRSGDEEVQESPASPNEDLDEEEKEEKESSESHENPIGDPGETWEDAGNVESLNDLTEGLFRDLEDLSSTSAGLSAESTPFDLDAIMEKENREAPVSTDTTLTTEQEASTPAAQDSSSVARKRQADEEIGNDAKKRKDSGQDKEDGDVEGGGEIQNCSPQ